MEALILPEIRKKYAEFIKLIDEEYKNDPETEPYKSKYHAKSILVLLRHKVSCIIDSLGRDDPQLTFFQAMLSVVLCQMGLLHIDVEETAEGERFLNESYDSIEDHLHSYFVLVSIYVRNNLGILWAERSEPIKAKSWFDGAEKVYKDFKSTGLAPRHVDSFFLEKDTLDGEEDLERVHTLTKFYLAQVYGTLKEPLKSALYCHETLKRQLCQRQSKDYNSVEWALNSATLAQFFLERMLFKQSRHHLAAASLILDEYEQSLSNLSILGEEMEAKKEELSHRSADISRCWAKYGILLLKHSINCLEMLREEEEEVKDKDKNEELTNLWFDGLDLTCYENEITDSVVILFEDAREIFLFTQKHLKKAKEYYSLENRASDHVEIVQDHSRLFKHLTAFESDTDRQCKMMKKRIDMLEFVLKELNPKYYLNVCQKLWFELGETYLDLMQVKYDKVKDTKDVPAPEALKKINTLIRNSISHLSSFIDSVKSGKKELPETLPEATAAGVLISHFYLGRLWSKYITQDRIKQIENTKKSYECFKYVVDYCDKDEKVAQFIGEELSVCREMMKFLKIKIMQY